MAVYKEPKTGKWGYRAPYKDITGKFKYKNKVGFRTKREAQQAESEFLKLRDSGKADVIGKMTLSTLNELYIKDAERVNKETTIATHERKIQFALKHLDKPVVNISMKDIKQWQDMLIDKEYSESYIKGIKARLSCVLEYGVQHHGLAQNVVKKVPFPKLKEVLNEDDDIDEKFRFITLEEFNQLDAVMPHNDPCDMIRLLYWTGLRKSEAYALNWTDYDGKYVMVRKGVSYKTRSGSDKLYILDTPKTSKSRRKVGVTNRLKAVLDAKYKRDKRIDGFNKKCFMFGVTRPIADETLRMNLLRHLELCGVHPITVHELRHSYASLLINNGVPLIVLSKTLGHSSVEITAKIYAHLFPKTEDLALETLNRL